MLDLLETLERTSAQFKRGRGKRAILDTGETFDAAEWCGGIDARAEIESAPSLPDSETE